MHFLNRLAIYFENIEFSGWSNPLILTMFWAKQNIAKIKVIYIMYDQYLKIANLRGITM